MSILDKVKGSLGFDDGDWEEEYDGSFDHEGDSKLVVRKRGERSAWDDPQEDYEQEQYEESYEEDEYEDTREDEPDEEGPRSYSRGNVRLTSRPGYAGYKPGDKPAQFEGVSGTGAPTPRGTTSAVGVAERTKSTPASAPIAGTGAPTPHRSRGVVTGREVTTGVEQRKAMSAASLHVATPRSFADAEIIGNRFKNSQPVLIDLTLVTNAVAQRVLDFAFGLTYGREGSIDRITDKAFMLTPRGHMLSASDRQRLVELGYMESRSSESGS